MYDLQAFAEGTLLATLVAGATSGTLTTGHTFQDATKIMLVIDPDVSAKREIVEATISSDAITSITRGKDNTSDVEHAPGAKVWGVFTPSNYIGLQTDIEALPKGLIASATRTSDVASTTFSVAVDITGVTTTFTVPTGGRRYKATLLIPWLTSSATEGSYMYGIIADGADTILQLATFRITTPAYAIPMYVFWEGNLAAGEHTIKGRMMQSATGTITANCGATFPTRIMVEDIGPTI